MEPAPIIAPRRPRLRPPPPSLILFALALLTALTGCAADRPLHVHVNSNVRRPDRSVVVFFVDGLGEWQFDEALAAGRIPNIQRHIVARGVRVENAVACLPTITYSNAVSFLTGRLPGRHGIVANKWFEPSAGRFESYAYIESYQWVDHDYDAPTIYEILGDRVTVNIQAAMHRGATHSIDNWATSGLNWYFKNLTGADCLVAQAFELVGQRSTWWGQWPDLIMTYFPGSDTVAHRFGPASEAYHQALANVDRQIGHICQALQDVGMYDRTCLVLVSDHGLTPIVKGNEFDLPSLLRERTGARVWFNQLTESPADAQALADCDYVVAMSASRWSAVYPVPGRDTPHTAEIAALSQALKTYEEDEPAADAHTVLPGWLQEAVAYPAVEMMACSFRPGVVHLFTRGGYAVITRTVNPVERHTVRQRPDSPVFGPDAGLRAASPILHPAPEMLSETDSPSSPSSDSRVWLSATARTPYPDLVPQLAAMFETERAGTFVFFAAPGWGFAPSDPAGGHGSILPEEVRVPMIFAGPGLSAGATIPAARTCDVMPTLLQLLGAEPVLSNGDRVDMDGVRLLP